MSAYTLFLYFIVLVKMLYSVSVLLQFTKLLGWSTFTSEFYTTNKERFENLYVLLMSSLVMFTFYNRNKGTYRFSRFESELFFIFGMILICQLFTNWYDKYVNVDHDEESNVVTTTTDFIIPAFKSA